MIIIISWNQSSSPQILGYGLAAKGDSGVFSENLIVRSTIAFTLFLKRRQIKRLANLVYLISCRQGNGRPAATSICLAPDDFRLLRPLAPSTPTPNLILLRLSEAPHPHPASFHPAFIQSVPFQEAGISLASRTKHIYPDKL